MRAVVSTQGASNTEPVKTNNYEIGWRGELGSNTTGTTALFYTTSKLGDVQSFNNGLILTRTKERIYGAEASADWLSDDAVWGAGGVRPGCVGEKSRTAKAGKT